MEAAEKSNIEKSQFQLINPSKINWSNYESKLDNQIAYYKKYLSEAIWQSLPEHEKIILNLEPPIDYDISRSSLLKSLEYSNWPVKKSDIELFDTEIKNALNYKRFAQELRSYFISKSSLNEYITNKDEEINDKDKINIINKSLKNFKKKSCDFTNGTPVIAGNNKLTYFYEGKIMKCVDSAHYDVKFTDVSAIEKNVLAFNIIKKNDSATYLTVFILKNKLKNLSLLI